MPKKEVVIIVPGAKYLSDRNHLTRSFVLFFYSTMRILKPVYTNYAKEWAGKFEQENREVIWLRWNRGFTIWSRWIASHMLKKEVLAYHKRGYAVKIIGISLGGDISLRVLNKVGDGIIDRIVLICSTNTDRKIEQTGTKIFNIYSPYDLFVDIATRFIAPIHGGMVMEGVSVENIAIENFSHDMFCADDTIETGPHKGKRITDLALDLLEK